MLLRSEALSDVATGTLHTCRNIHVCTESGGANVGYNGVLFLTQHINLCHNAKV